MTWSCHSTTKVLIDSRDSGGAREILIADLNGDGITDDVDACANEGDQGYGVTGGEAMVLTANGQYLDLADPKARGY